MDLSDKVQALANYAFYNLDIKGILIMGINPGGDAQVASAGLTVKGVKVLLDTVQKVDWEKRIKESIKSTRKQGSGKDYLNLEGYFKTNFSSGTNQSNL